MEVAGTYKFGLDDLNELPADFGEERRVSWNTADSVNAVLLALHSILLATSTKDYKPRVPSFTLSAPGTVFPANAVSQRHSHPPRSARHLPTVVLDLLSKTSIPLNLAVDSVTEAAHVCSVVLTLPQVSQTRAVYNFASSLTFPTLNFGAYFFNTPSL